MDNMWNGFLELQVPRICLTERPNQLIHAVSVELCVLGSCISACRRVMIYDYFWVVVMTGVPGWEDSGPGTHVSGQARIVQGERE